MKAEIKKEAKRAGTTPKAIKALARGLVQQQNAKNQLILNKTQISSARLQITEMKAQLRIALSRLFKHFLLRDGRCYEKSDKNCDGHGKVT